MDIIAELEAILVETADATKPDTIRDRLMGLRLKLEAARSARIRELVAKGGDIDPDAVGDLEASWSPGEADSRVEARIVDTTTIFDPASYHYADTGTEDEEPDG